MEYILLVLFTVGFSLVLGWFFGRHLVDPDSYKGKVYYSKYEREEICDTCGEPEGFCGQC